VHGQLIRIGQWHDASFNRVAEQVALTRSVVNATVFSLLR
jgi:hypothetical protein